METARKVAAVQRGGDGRHDDDATFGDRPARDFSDYILALDLPEAPPQLEAAEGVSIEYGSAREAVAVGAQIAEFSAQVSPQVREAVANSGKSVALLIQRDGNKIFVPVRVG